MNVERECIKKFTINQDILIIECNKYFLNIPIICGSIEIYISNDMDEKIGLNELHENDNIIIFYREINEYHIKPLKIMKLSNYTFNESSQSSSEDFFI